MKTKNLIVIILSSIFVFLLCHTSIASQNYYVSPAGDNNNNCLYPEAPCKTIQHTIDIATGTKANLANIKVAAGTYFEHIDKNPVH